MQRLSQIAVFLLLAGCVTDEADESLVSQDVRMWPQGTYSDWELKQTGLYNLDINLTIEAADATRTWYWAHQFGFVSSGEVGYLGLQAQGSGWNGVTGKMANFAIWGSDAARGNCAKNDESGGPSCNIAYDWQVGRSYRLRVWATGTDATGEWWSAWVRDNTTGAEQQIGSIHVPAGRGWLGGSTVSWSEYFAANGTGGLDRCTDLPYSRIAWSAATGNNGTVTARTKRNHLAQGPTTCSNGSVTDVAGGGSRQEMGGTVASRVENRAADLFVFPTPGISMASYRMYAWTQFGEADALWPSLPMLPDDRARYFVADYNRDGFQDLYFILMNGTGTHSTEVHVLDGSYGFQRFLLQTGTPLGETTREQFDFAVGDTTGDNIPEVVAIKRTGTGTGRTEIHVLGGGSNYHSFTLQAGLPIPMMGASQARYLLGDWNNDRRMDLYLVKLNGTGTRSTEIHVLDAAQSFQKFVVQTGTALHETTNDVWRFVIGDYDHDLRPDVYAVITAGTGTNTVEVHSLSGASGYRTMNIQTGTAMPMADAASLQPAGG